MAHQIETILASVVTILKAAGTDAGASAVHRGRTLPIEADENAGDVINVYEGDEISSLDGQTMNSPKKRTQQLFVELHKRALPTDQNDPGSIDTAMNEFYRQVEVALEADFTLGSTCNYFEHVGTRRDREAATRELRVLTLELQVEYRTARTNPAVRA